MSTQNNGRLALLLKDAEVKSTEYNKLLEGGNEMSAQETKRAGDLSAELKSLKATYKELSEGAEAAAEFKSLLSNPASPFAFGGKPQHFGDAEVNPATGEVRGIKGMSEAVLGEIAKTSYKDAWGQYMAKGFHGISDTARKALQEGADASGGFLVPEEMQQLLVQKDPTPTRISANVRHFTTGRDHLTFPTNVWGTDDIYTSPIRMVKTGEIPAAASTAQQTDPTFGQTRVQVYTYMVNGQITRDLIEDSLFDLQSFLVDKYNEAATILKDLKFLSGSGNGDVNGILANPGSTVGGLAQPAVVNMGNPVTGDGVLNLAYAVPEQYDENCKFLMNKVNGLRTLALLKDSSNRYLFGTGNYGDGPGIATARPKELVGYPYLLSGLMPDPGANNFPYVFGDLSGYYAVDRVGMAIQVLDQTKATLNQIELVGRLRFGGAPVEAWKLKAGKQA